MSIPDLVKTAAPLRHSGMVDYWQATIDGEAIMVRRFCPTPLWGPMRRAQATADFIRTMRVQNAIARQTPRWQAVTSIEATSMDEAWSTATAAPCTAHRLILMQIMPEPAELFRLVRDILASLQDARTAAGRTHGQLSADRILLSSLSIGDADIMLCEPSPSGSLETTVQADLQALGRIICELLTGRFWSPSAPLNPSSDAFRRCGSNWRAWMAFTNDLLSLDHTAESLDHFAASLDSLRPRKSRAPMVYAALAVMLLIIVAAFLYLRHRQEMARLARFNGAWPVYVSNYNTWFSELVKNRALLNSNPLFKPVVKSLQSHPVLNPNNILHEFTALLSREKIQHDLAQSARASRQFGVAVVLLMQSEHALAKIHAQLVASQSAWMDNGWTAPARELKSDLLARLQPDAALKPFLKLLGTAWTKKSNIRHISARSSRAARIWMADLLAAQRVENHYQSLKASLSVLARNAHPLLAHFSNYAINYLKRCQSIQALGQAVMIMDAQSRQARDDLRRYATRLQWKQIDARPQPMATTPPEHYFPHWFSYCSIPRKDNPYLKHQAAIAAMIRSIRVNIGRATRLPKPPTVNYTALLKHITAPLTAAAASDAWIEKNKAHLTASVLAARRRLASLHSQIVAFIDSQINLKKWVAQFIGFNGPGQHYTVKAHALTPFPMTAVNSLYQKRIGLIIFGPKAQPTMPWAANNRTYQFLLQSLRTRRWQVPEINTRVAALKASLGHLMNSTFAISHIQPPPQISKSDLTRLLTGTLTPARMAAIEVACRLGHFAPHETFIVPRKVISDWQRRQKAFHQLINGVSTLEQQLQASSLLNAPIAQDRSPASLYTQLENNRWWANPTVASVTANLRRTVAMALRLQSGSETKLKSLVLQIKSYPARWQPFLLRTTWHRVGQLPLEANNGLLTLERSVGKTLEADMRTDSIKKSHPHLATQLLSSLKNRWQQRVNQAGPLGLVVAVMSASPDYGVTIRKIRSVSNFSAYPHLSAAARFNLLFFTLTRQAAGIRSPQTAKQVAAQFVNVLNSAVKHRGYQSWKALPPYAHLLAALQGVLKANPAKAAQPSGPALAGWREQKLSPAQRLFVDPDGRRHLQFSLVHVSHGRSFFLCDEELRVGIFLHTIHSSHNILHSPASAFFDLIKYNNDYLGPHTWVYSRRTDDIAVAPTWFTNTNQIYAAPRFPASIAASAGRLKASSGGNPTRHMPVQYLPPKAAVYLAALLGCRLPTVAQWQAAYRQSKGVAIGAALPGKGLAAYVAYLRNEDSTIDARLPTPRFWDIFGDSAAALSPYRNAYLKTGTKRIFFRPIASGGSNPQFANLVGNVAEYVFNGDTRYRQQLKLWYKNPSTLTVKSVSSLLSAKAMKQFYVIGGSALTPLGKITPDTPISINWQTRRAKRGFSDVGIRLAYNRRVLTPQQLLARLIRQDEYCRSTS